MASTEDINKQLELGICAMYICYAILIAAITHNIVRFVILQKRYLNFNIAYFYVVVSMIVIVRVTWFSLIFHSIYQNYAPIPEGGLKKIYYADVIATYLELLLGIQ